MKNAYDIYGMNLRMSQEEHFAQYCIGGYHPVMLGDVFNQRYEVVHKLGHGSYGIVWLAHDKRSSSWVALKILRADQTHHSEELKHFQELQTKIHHDLSSAHIVQLLDHFKHEGVNGVHQCLVLELLGQTVHGMWDGLGRTPDPVFPEDFEVFQMTIACLEGLFNIHRAGYAFGDLSPKNFASVFGSSANLTKKQMLDILGHPETEFLQRLDDKPIGKHCPPEIVLMTDFDNWDDSDDYRLIDLGTMFNIRSQKFDHPQAGNMHPPERIFEGSIGVENDSWCAGMMIYYFIFCETAIGGGDENRRAAEMIELFGPVPREWEHKWNRMQTILQQEAPHRNHFYPPGSQLAERFKSREHSSDIGKLIPVIQNLMHVNPKRRVSPRTALKSVLDICKHSHSKDIRKFCSQKNQKSNSHEEIR